MREGKDTRTLSVRRDLTLGFSRTVVLVGGSTGWSVLAWVSGAVITMGRVAVETRNQMVEYIEA